MKKQEKLAFIKRVETLSKTKVKTIAFINNGITNDNYLINDAFIYKVKNPLISHQNNLKNETTLANYLSSRALTPRHHFFTNEVIIDYLADTTFINCSNYDKYLAKLVKAIKTIHDLPLQGFSGFNMFERLEFYQKSCNHESLKGLEKIIERTKYYYTKAKLTVTHNDLVNGNILVRNDELYLIDFEYCGINDPDFDVVSFLSENEFVDQEVRDEFYKCYYQEEEIPFDKLTIYFKFADALWYYWALYAYKKTKKAIFLQIAKLKRENYNKN